MSDDPTLSEIYRILVRVDERTVLLDDRTTRLDERTAQLDARTARLDEHIFVGNGSPPLLSRLATIEERTKNLARTVAAFVGALVGWQFGPKP